VWLVVGEVPPQLTFVGGALVLLTVALHAGLGVRESRRLTARRELLGKEA